MKLSGSINVLLLGAGGREDAFAWKISQCDRVSQLFIAPGNAGSTRYGTNVDLDPTSFGSVKQFILLNSINLVVVGPEQPLVNGIYDYLQGDSETQSVPVIGPSMMGAKLEGSKDFAKAFMMRHNIPTARYRSVTKDTIDEGRAFMEGLKPPYVLKASGLAAGKGVLIIDSLEQAKLDLESMLAGKFGSAGSTVVIEEFLSGVECSVFVATDGKNYKILPVAKDYKRIGDRDTGLNTGGMGAVSPVCFANAEFMERVCRHIIEPTIKGLTEEEIIYKGFIFVGIMSVAGEPYVIEYNVRMGDPECQTVLPLVESDIIELFEAIAFEKLDSYELKISTKSAVTVVCVSDGYPGDYRKGDEIMGLDVAARSERSLIFHAGTTLKAEGIYTNGGRVLAVTSLGDSVEEARQKSYKTIAEIEYKGKYFRRDIGEDLM